MNKLISVPVIGIILVCLIISFVTAYDGRSNSPLYTMRMEQVSNRMHFMPGESHGFIYAAEQGCEMPYNVVYSGSVTPLGTANETNCAATCPSGCTTDTCYDTCSSTCPNTCEYTCPDDCYINDPPETSSSTFHKDTSAMNGC